MNSDSVGWAVPLRRCGARVMLVAAAVIAIGCAEKSIDEQARELQRNVETAKPSDVLVSAKAILRQRPNDDSVRLILARTLRRLDDLSGAEIEAKNLVDRGYMPDVTTPLLASIRLAKGMFREVATDFGKVELADSKAEAELKATVGLAFLGMGQTERAADAVAGALKADPTSIEARVVQARLLATKQSVNAALAELDSILKESPANVDALVMKGQLLAATSAEPKVIIAAFSAAIEAQPKRPDAYLYLVDIHLRERQVEDAKRVLTTMSRVVPSSVAALVARTRVALAERNVDDAINASSKLVQADLNRAEYFYLAGLSQYLGASYVHAAAHFGRAVGLAPGSRAARIWLAKSYLRLGEAEKSRAAIVPLLQESRQDFELASVAAGIEMQMGNMDAAATMYRNALALRPDDVHAKVALARLDIAQGKLDQGLDSLQLLARNTDQPIASAALVSSLVSAKKFDEAASAVAAWEKADPASPEPSFVRARVSALRKDGAGARKAYEEALTRSKSPSAKFRAIDGLAALDLAERKQEQALKRYEAFVAEHPDQPDALFALARQKYSAGQDAEGAQLLERVLRLRPADQPARMLQIQMAHAKQGPQVALQRAQEAVASDEANVAFHIVHGNLLVEVGDYQNALRVYGKIAQSQPKSAGPHLLVAQTYLKAGDDERALGAFRKALDVDPTLVEVYRQVVAVQIRLNRFADAMALASEAQRALGRDGIGKILEGDVHAARKAWPAATKSYESALAKPIPREAAARLHRLLTMSGDDSGAKAFERQYLTKNPKDPLFLEYLGDRAFAKGDVQSAEGLYRRTLDLLPGEVGALNNLAWLLLRSGKAGALELAERAAQLAPGRPDVLDTLAHALAAGGACERAKSLAAAVARMESKSATYALSAARVQTTCKNAQGARELASAALRIPDLQPREKAEAERILKAPS